MRAEKTAKVSASTASCLVHITPACAVRIALSRTHDDERRPCLYDMVAIAPCLAAPRPALRSPAAFSSRRPYHRPTASLSCLATPRHALPCLAAFSSRRSCHQPTASLSCLATPLALPCRATPCRAQPRRAVFRSRRSSHRLTAPLPRRAEPCRATPRLDSPRRDDP